MTSHVHSNQIVAKGKSRRRNLALATGLAALLLTVLGLYAGLSAGPQGTKDQMASEAAFLAANPELMVARRYAAVPARKAELAFLAANPELLVVRRYIAPATGRTESAYLAANPELMVARRYIAGAAQQSDPAFLAANPEIMLYRRYVATQQATDDEPERLCCR
jgi:hypothetical protein